MSGDSKPGAWVDGIGWVAKLHSLDVGTRARLGDIGPPFVVSVVDRVQIPGNPVAVVVRWADGTTPAAPSGQAMEGRCSSCGTPLYMRGRGGCDECKALTAPSGHNGTDYQWVCVESCTADDPHGEHCDWQTTAPSPDTVALRALAVEALARLAEPCSGCDDTGWSVDENWSPEYGEARSEGRGLTPCGFCNEGDWSEYRDEFTADKSWPGPRSWRSSEFIAAASPSTVLALIDATPTADTLQRLRDSRDGLGDHDLTADLIELLAAVDAVLAGDQR